MNYNAQDNAATCFDVTGKITLPFNKNGEVKPNGSIILSDTFNNINTDIWSSWKSGDYRGWIYLPENYSNNAYTEDGQLIVKLIKNNPATNYEWSGASLHTNGKFTFQYGTILAQLKFPNVNKYHATLWMLGQQNRGEIDIAESDNGTVTCNLHYYDATGGEEGHIKYRIGTYNINPTEYNAFQLLWTYDRISAYCNGNLIGSFDVNEATIDGYNSFRQPFYLVYNALPLTMSDKTYYSGDSFEMKMRNLVVYQ